MFKFRLVLTALSVFVVACEPTEKERHAPTGDAAPQTADAAIGTDAGETSDAFIGVDAGVNSGYLMIADDTQGIAIGDYGGADIDGVQVVCGDTIAYASGVWGPYAASLDEEVAQRALGPAEQNDCVPSDCATPITKDQALGLIFNIPVVSGCEVTVYEAADQANNNYQVYVCTAPDFNLDNCVGPVFSGGDGAATIRVLDL